MMSRIPLFGLRWAIREGENEKLGFSPLLNQREKNITNLARKGNSNVLARGPIISASTVSTRLARGTSERRWCYGEKAANSKCRGGAII